MSRPNKIFTNIKKAAQLYIIWLAFCIPVITIGAATAAAYNVAFRMINKKNPDVFKDFIKAFKQDLLQGTIVYIIEAAVIFGATRLVNYLITSEPDTPIMIASIFILVMAYCYIAYIIPVVARYTNKTYLDFEASLLSCTRNIPKTLIHTAFLALLLTLYFTKLVNPFVLIFAGLPIYFWIKAPLTIGIFKKQEVYLAEEKKRIDEEARKKQALREEQDSEEEKEEADGTDPEENEEDSDIEDEKSESKDTNPDGKEEMEPSDSLD